MICPLAAPFSSFTSFSLHRKNRRISKGSASHSSKEPISLLRDNDQPFIFDISFFNRPYRFEFYDTSSPENWTLLNLTCNSLCYNISIKAQPDKCSACGAFYCPSWPLYKGAEQSQWRKEDYNALYLGQRASCTFARSQTRSKKRRRSKWYYISSRRL
jgi:hypothetical protein